MKKLFSVSLIVLLFALSACNDGGNNSKSSNNKAANSKEIDKKMAEFSDYKAKLNYETSEVILPDEEFNPQSNKTFFPLLSKVKNKKVAACYESLSGKKLIPGDTTEDDVLKQDRTFGVWSVSYVSKYGYDFAGGRSKVMFTNLTQEDQNDNFMKCASEVHDEYEEMFKYSEQQNEVSLISGKAYMLTLNNAGYKKYSDKAVECYKKAGYEVEVSEGLANLMYDYESDSREIQVKAAVTEAKCNVDTGFIENAYNLYARYQLALMADKEALVAENKKKISDYIKQLEAEL